MHCLPPPPPPPTSLILAVVEDFQEACPVPELEVMTFLCSALWRWVLPGTGSSKHWSL